MKISSIPEAFRTALASTRVTASRLSTARSTLTTARTPRGSRTKVAISREGALTALLARFSNLAPCSKACDDCEIDPIDAFAAEELSRDRRANATNAA